MKLQFVSDIHLELRSYIPVIEPVEPGNTYLALCGDIGNPCFKNYKDFLSHHSKTFEHILIISGNHEYYSDSNTMSDMENKIRSICDLFKNVTYLNTDKIIIGRTKFIGCTLWSDTSNICEKAKGAMNDYKYIYVKHGKFKKTRKIKPLEISKIHRYMRFWIEKEIKLDNRYDDIIVLTHHPPSFSMLDINDVYSPCYGSNCEYLLKEPVKYWISGHTHSCKSVEINDINLLSNCMGYPRQNIKGFNENKYIDFY
uniref:Calcineurin-like phosphoesterase n=1 Tax=Pithovirus LCPAC302 TaxID=2506593 RepID=A0A481Z6W4_9VIRU|nr:MAG: calcineurin-like phosphoesterase [Pithovirus LCPAC302]